MPMRLARARCGVSAASGHAIAGKITQSRT
jgi:hypothetical protein